MSALVLALAAWVCWRRWAQRREQVWVVVSVACATLAVERVAVLVFFNADLGPDWKVEVAALFGNAIFVIAGLAIAAIAVLGSDS